MRPSVRRAGGAARTPRSDEGRYALAGILLAKHPVDAQHRCGAAVDGRVTGGAHHALQAGVAPPADEVAAWVGKIARPATGRAGRSRSPILNRLHRPWPHSWALVSHRSMPRPAVQPATSGSQAFARRGLKNSRALSMTNCGFSSGTKCPQFSTAPPSTFSATSAQIPVMSPR